MNKNIEAERIKRAMAKKYLKKEQCCVPNCQNKRSGLVIHHRWYTFNDIVYKSYPKGVEGKLAYHIALESVIKALPKRFRLYCNKHHQALERLIRYNDITLNHLLKERKIAKRHGR